MRQQIRNRAASEFRQAAAPDVLSECISENLSWTKRAARLIRRMCEAERPVIFPNERIAFTRTVPAVPPILNPKEWDAYTKGYTIHELGPINNICADWGMVLIPGFEWPQASCSRFKRPAFQMIRNRSNFWIAPSRRLMLSWN